MTNRIAAIRAAVCCMLLLLPAAGQAVTVQASWETNSEPDLGGYRLYWGTASRGSATNSSQFSYATNRFAAVSPTPSATVSNLLDDATYYFAVTASDTNGNESAFSCEGVFGPGCAFVAYNDLAWFPGQVSLNITTYTTTNGVPDAVPEGRLVDYASGQRLPVTVYVTGGDEVHDGQGANPAPGTDAYGVFAGKVNCTGLVGYATSDLELRFNGMDPDFAYDIVVYSDRNVAAYVGVSNRYHYGTISGADAFQNASTPGTTILTNSVPNDTTFYNAGYNTLSGRVTRFANVNPGTDREVLVTIKRNADQKYYTYGNALMVKAAPARTVLVEDGSEWRYRKGTAEAASPATAWREMGFSDAGWTAGNLPIGYGNAGLGTTLGDMSNAYSTVFLRRTFTVENPARVRAFDLWAKCDDGFILWVNGEEAARLNVPGARGEFLPYNTLAVVSSNVTWTARLQDADRPGLCKGTNVLALQVFNRSRTSSDLYMDLKAWAVLDRLSPLDDTDEDALPDDWETTFFLNTNRTGSTDFDGDGLLDADELVCGTDPTNDASTFAVDAAVSNNQLLVFFRALAPGGPGIGDRVRRYALERRALLAGDAWQGITGYTNLLGAGQTVVFTNAGGDSARFYRGRVWLEE